MRSVGWLVFGGVVMALAYVLPVAWTFRQVWMPRRKRRDVETADSAETLFV